MGDFFNRCMRLRSTGDDAPPIYELEPATRALALRILRALVVDHLVGQEILVRAGGFVKAAELVRGSLPKSKRIRSGDLGEVLAVEFLHEQTRFRSPILKLRYKSDRDTPLHGNDVVAIDRSSGRPVLLKGECKSRKRFARAHLGDAISALEAHGCRPNPSTLAFITKRLYEEERDEEAVVFRDLQGRKGLRLSDIEHFVFVLAGNDPSAALGEMPEPSKPIRRRWCVASVVAEHEAFVEAVFTFENGS